jgi:GNAT superfamily N-acetyltransferase
MTDRPFGIEEAAPDDLPQLLELYRCLHPGDPALDPAAGDVQAIWRSILADPRHHCLVGRCDGRIVATCILLIVPNLTRGGRSYAIIENVVTHPDYRRRGFAGGLLRHAVSMAWGEGCYKVELLTSRNDEAVLRFYEGAGFDRGDKTAFVIRNPAHLRS